MDTLAELLNKGYYASLGALALLLETVQDEQKRSQAVKRLQDNIEGLVQELVKKGVATESEARSYVDRVVSQRVKTVDTNAQEAKEETSPENEIDQLRELTKQLAELRAELEQKQ
ncbi:MAG: hypothetical protein ACK4QL_11385 [Pseudanabaenaceae cyanobacterium]